MDTPSVSSNFSLTLKDLVDHLSAKPLYNVAPDNAGTDSQSCTPGADNKDLTSTDQTVTHIAYRSSDVAPGSVFCCIPGLKRDGHEFAADAAQRGATALLVSHDIEKPQNGCPVYQVQDPRKAMAEAAASLYQHPSDQLSLVGVTGTNGKTTTVTLTAWIARQAGLISGTVGTLGAYFNGTFVPTDNTTPESVDYQALLAHGLEVGCDLIACEVSSHALALERVWSTSFEVVAFTNLTQDHLDYHTDMEDYYQAKRKLFIDYTAKTRVICVDDEWGARLADECKERGLNTLTVASKPDLNADIQLITSKLSAAGTHLVCQTTTGNQTETFDLDVPLIGSFNMQNILVAYGIGRALNLDHDVLARALKAAPQVPGRLERVGADSNVAVYVDYAHTPDALEKAMEAVKETQPNRLITVFGCGGDRDNTKRAPMGKAAAACDIAVCTSDNPRTEDPLRIIDMIKAGLLPEADKTGARVIIEPDRVEAIYAAIQCAEPGDAVLIAGKGHEDYQIIGTQKFHLDDRETAAQALQELK